MTQFKAWLGNGGTRLLVEIALALITIGVGWQKLTALEAAFITQAVVIEHVRATAIQTNLSVAKIESSLKERIERADKEHAGFEKKDEALDRRIERLEDLPR